MSALSLPSRNARSAAMAVDRFHEHGAQANQVARISHGRRILMKSLAQSVEQAFRTNPLKLFAPPFRLRLRWRRPPADTTHSYFFALEVHVDALCGEQIGSEPYLYG